MFSIVLVWFEKKIIYYLLFIIYYYLLFIIIYYYLLLIIYYLLFMCLIQHIPFLRLHYWLWLSLSI